MKTPILSLLILACSIQTANAQLYGTSPIHNSTVVETPGLYTFDPDTGFWLTVNGAYLPGFTVVGINGVTIHPRITPDPNGFSGKMYAILKVSGVTGRVLATIDPIVDPGNGNATQIGNLGDNFSSLAFDSAGQLYGATGDGAAVPEALYLIDKTNAAKTLLFAMGNGADGEVIAFNPEDEHLYHWSGNGTVIMEKWPIANPSYLPTNIPIIGITGGETFGMVFDPCRNREVVAGVPQTSFISSNVSSNSTREFRFLAPTGTYGPAVASNQEGIRGLALVGGYHCDVDLGAGISADNPIAPAGSSIIVTVGVSNVADARAIDPKLVITLPPSLTGATTSGCVEDPAGIPTCTIKVTGMRLNPNAPRDPPIPFVTTNLVKNAFASITISASSDGNGGVITATASSTFTGGANSGVELVPADNVATLMLGISLFKDGFE